MDPAEVEFLAEKEPVTVIPNFSLDKVYLIGVSESLSFVKMLFFWLGLIVLWSGINNPYIDIICQSSNSNDTCYIVTIGLIWYATLIPAVLTLVKRLCAQGDLGPFNPGLPVDVPVWLALNLKQRQRCRIVPPAWMDVGEPPHTRKGLWLEHRFFRKSHVSWVIVTHVTKTKPKICDVALEISTQTCSGLI